MANSKFEFTGETKVVADVTLHRIRALRDFGSVKAGDLGGWLEREANLSTDGDAWVYGDAQVSGNARVSGKARVYDNAVVSRDASVYGSAVVAGDALVFGKARVNGNARVSDSAWVYGKASVYDNAQVSGDAQVFGCAELCGNARVFGNPTRTSDNSPETMLKPLTSEQIELATGVKQDTPLWLAVLGIVRAIERSHGIQ